ncbi:hypothetical protein DFP72DRAFT_1072474 [Ephemerocybe angulata]|uniref:Uncharacterized protein n=1 Tax=Ephemerocybe angulata TaxID=980116 RepID=A0A8H6HPL0_9AGAR|nr:hypothetical protein DFP72DRAFT_1072474 [Tulosesus angulatus]
MSLALVAVALKQKRGIVGILEQVMKAARGAYKVRSFSEQERRLSKLLWRLGGDQRLQLPALSESAEPIPDSADHLSPKYLKGDYKVKNVTPQTCWRLGCERAEADYEPAARISEKAEEQDGVDMLSPIGPQDILPDPRSSCSNIR